MTRPFKSLDPVTVYCTKIATFGKNESLQVNHLLANYTRCKPGKQTT